MAAVQKFKVGDHVYLISGGPSMTVVRYEPKDSEDVVCQWFHKSQREEKAFHQDTLKIYTPPSFSSIGRRNLP